MTENHTHPQPVGRQANAESRIAMLNLRLDEKAQHIRKLEDAEVNLAALVNEVTGENGSLTAALDQVRAENMVLRKRLDLPALGPIEITEDEAKDVGPAGNVYTVPDPGEPGYLEAEESE